MLAEYVFLMQSPVITVLTETSNINEKNLRIVEVVSLLALATIGPLIIITGLCAIIKKKPILLHDYCYEDTPPESIPKLALYYGLGTILAGMGFTGLTVWCLDKLWNIDWLA